MSGKKALTLLYTAAFAARVIYLAGVRADPTFSVPVVDSAAYRAAAESIVAGHGFPPGALTYGPLYPLLLALFLKITGGAPFLLHLAQVMVVSLAAPILAALGTRLFGRTEGFVAGAIAAIYWPWIYFDGEFLVEPVLIPLLLLLAYLLVRLEEKKNRPRGPLPVLAAGLLLGLCAVTRPNALLFLPVWFVLYAFRRRWRDALLLAAGCAVPILPVTARNIAATGEFVLISSTGGINFFIGNNARATGRDSAFPGLTQWTFEKVHRLAEEESGGPLGDAEVSRYYFRRGIRFIGRNPAAWIKLTGRKVVQLLSAYEMPNVKDPNFQRTRSRFLDLPILPSFGIIAPLAFFGYFRRRRGRSPRGPVLLFAGVYAISVILFFVNGRYRIPLTPFFILFASTGLVDLAQRMRRRRWKGVGVAPVVAFATAVIVVNANFLGKVPDDSQAHFNQAWAAQKGGDFETALTEYEQVRKENRWYPIALNNKAQILRDMGRIDDAERALREAVEIDPTYYEGWFSLGGILFRKHDFAGAETAYRRTVALWPKKASYHVNLGVALKNERKFEEALIAFDDALAIDPDLEEARSHRTDMLIALGRLGEAMGDLEQIVRESPDNMAARYHLGLAYRREGREEDARREWETILRDDPGSAAAKESAKQLGDDDER